MSGDGKVLWTVGGSNWTYSIRDDRQKDPVEIATIVLESICEECDTENFFQKLCGEDVLTVGVLLAVRNSDMKSRDEHLMVPTSTVLANAGFFREAGELEGIWTGMSEVDQLRHLLKILH